ncbi:MAG: MFS transporter [Sciscionella sp.]
MVGTQAREAGTASKRRWLILGVGVFAQASSCAFLYGVPFLVPAMRASEGLNLAQAGTVVAGPTVGLLLTLIAWGAAADRFGERVVMATGLALTGLLVAVARTWAHGLPLFVVVLGLAGAAGASVNAASGRMIMGWFGKSERGVAMGIRQTAQPLGVGIASLSLPLLAEHIGFRDALLLPAGLCVLAAALVASLAADPPRPVRQAGEAKPRSPYRTPTLWRLHGASALLVLPQFVIAAFALEYLVSTQHWAAAAAGTFIAVVQVAGACGRIVTGYWSDRVGSRLRPMRQLAVASTGVMLMFAVGAAVAPWLAVVAIAVGAVITVADNGLAFTSTAEMAGPAWAGRALGVQNTGQNIVASLTPPVLGLVIGGSSYGFGLAVAAVFPLLAIAVTPVRAEARG